MKLFLSIAMTSAVAFSAGIATQTVHAGDPPAKVELCHFAGHMSETPVPTQDPLGDHLIDGSVGHDRAGCEARGGTVMTVACPTLKGHINLPDEIIERYCATLGQAHH